MICSQNDGLRMDQNMLALRYGHKFIGTCPNHGRVLCNKSGPFSLMQYIQ